MCVIGVSKKKRSENGEENIMKEVLEKDSPRAEERQKD